MEKYTKYFFPIISFILANIYFAYFCQFGLQIYQLVAIFITNIGYLLWLYGRYTLGKSYSLLPQAKSIVSAGIYSKISHPLYLSQMITLYGFILFIRQEEMWALFFLILCIQLYRAKQEEKILIKEFGDQYLNYKKSTWF